MADDNTATSTADESGTGESTSTTTSSTVTDAGTGTETTDDVKELKAALAKANKDAERNRRKAETIATEATETARAEMAKAISAALGAEDQSSSDPVALARTIEAKTGENASLITENAELKRQLAVFAVAGDQYRASALLDSRSFLNSITEVDPTDHQAITAAITAAAEANPAFKTAPDRRLPGVNPGQGSSGGAPSAEEAARAAETDGNWRAAGQVKASQLLDLRNNNRT